MALALVCAAAFVACTSDDDPAPRVVASPSTAPVAGGSVVVGVVGSPPTLDPYAPEATDLTYALVRPLYPSLYRFDPDGTPRPYLAASVDRGRNRTVVQLERLEWSDGRPVTAGDVVASARRARPPSGWAAYDVRARSRFEIEIAGPANDFEQRLATLAFVLPRGRPGRATGAPFRLQDHTPGLEIVYRRPGPYAPGSPFLRRITVRFFATLDSLLLVLERGDVDVAALPSTVNLDARLDGVDAARSEALGWERIYLDMEGAPGPQTRCAIAKRLDREVLQEGFLRGDGRISNTLHPGPGVIDGPWKSLGCRGRGGGTIRVAAPIGDELLLLMQRVVQRQLAARGFEVELIQTEPEIFYGEWPRTDPFDVAIRRSAGAPRLRDPAEAIKEMTAFPLAQVETVVGHKGRVQGIRVNPTFEGPLWNAQEWWVARSSS